MGDRHGGCFARRGRALNPPHPHIDAHRGVGFRWRARAKEFAPREKALLGESLPTRRTSERICPAQEHAPRRRPPDTAHEQKNLPTRERSPRRRPPDTAHERKDLPHAGTLSSAKASRHGARAKEFAPRENTPHGEGLPTRRTSERICPAQEHAPRRRPPDTAHERKDLPPRRVRVRPTCRRTAGRPRATDSRKNTPSAGSHPRGRGRCRVHSPKKKRLLHEIQLFYGESHVGSR